MRGKGENDAHRRMDAEASHEIPHVSMDRFMGQGEGKCLPILVMKDRRSKMVFPHVVPKKGASIAYCVSRVVRNLELLGHPKRIFKCDREPAVLDLRSVVAKECKENGMEVLPESLPVAESQGNGAARSLVRRCTRSARACITFHWSDGEMESFLVSEKPREST